MGSRRGVVLVLSCSMAPAQQPSADSFAQQVAPLLQRYCTKCHSGAEPEADLDLARFRTAAVAEREPKVWQLALDMLGSGDMPPRDEPQPSLAERDALRQHLHAMLATLARAHAGDPGPVRLRRLDNAAFTYALRDLTGLADLEPARDFPADSAAGEGFTNVGDALVMSPMLVEKYLAAGKSLAAHAVLTRDGITFSPHTTRRDHTEELLAAIRALYARYSQDDGGERVDLQGVVFATNGDGRLPLGRYLAAALAVRDGADPQQLAQAQKLSPKYLQQLHTTLTAAPQPNSPSPLLDALRQRWRDLTPAELPALRDELRAWQRQLWAFKTVGHIGKRDGPRAWQEPVALCREQIDLRQTLAEPAPRVHIATRALSAGDARVRLRRPRLVAPGRPDILLRDLDAVSLALRTRREALRQHADALLAAAAAAASAPLVDAAVRNQLAQRHGLPEALLDAWLHTVGLGMRAEFTLLEQPHRNVAGHASVTAWATGELPSIVANSGDATLHIPGTVTPHGLAVHPTPQQRVLVAWRSPSAAQVDARATVRHAHTTCGNGVTYGLELRRGQLRIRLAQGLAIDAETVTIEAAVGAVRPGDALVLWVGARDADHRCDLTAVDLTVRDRNGALSHLAADVADDLLAGNPHTDQQGRAGVWCFAQEPDVTADDPALAKDTPLAAWLLAADTDLHGEPALALRAALTQDGGAPDPQLWRSPLFADCFRAQASTPQVPFDADGDVLLADQPLSLDVPRELSPWREFVASAEPASDATAAAQVTLDATAARLQPGAVLARAGSAGHAAAEAAAAEFRALFPIALCYAQIVPVDEVVTLTLFHREDEPLCRLMLDAAEIAQLERLWADLHFVSRDALDLVDVFEQLWQYATQDADPSVFEPLRAPIAARARAFRAELLAAEPRHLAAVVALAERAFRRPLHDAERSGLHDLYARLRADGLDHDASIRLLLARIVVAPQFLYRSEQPGPGATPTPVTAHELATRLSFALWSSLPDDRLRAAADDASLRSPEVLLGHARRMLQDPRARRFALEFGATWLHLRDFAQASDKSERHFPGFDALRPNLLEQVVLTFLDLIQRDASVLELLDADHTFVDAALAAHYGIAGVTGAGWQRVAGMRALGRGGILGLGAVLASQAGASRTSPILRGNFVSEVLLGERLPRPPKDVPRLPEDEAGQELTVRQLVERHRQDPRCAQCHDRIDAFGFALEGFDAIGRSRTADLAGRPLDTRAQVRDGTWLDGAAGLRSYLGSARRDAFLRQFSRKLLGYCLGRAVRLSDEPLLDDIARHWPEHGHRFGYLLERILLSPQFLNIRGRDAKHD